MSDEIARHAAQRGHWPGKSAPNGETIYRKGDIILIESADQGEGTVFEPTGNALDYFRRWVRRNPGGS